MAWYYNLNNYHMYIQFFTRFSHLYHVPYSVHLFLNLGIEVNLVEMDDWIIFWISSIRKVATWMTYPVEGLSTWSGTTIGNTNAAALSPNLSMVFMFYLLYFVYARFLRKGGFRRLTCFYILYHWLFFSPNLTCYFLDQHTHESVWNTMLSTYGAHVNVASNSLSWFDEHALVTYWRLRTCLAYTNNRRLWLLENMKLRI